jgi:hypothetical protein
MDGIVTAKSDNWLSRGEVTGGPHACKSFECATEISVATSDLRIWSGKQDETEKLSSVVCLREPVKLPIV